MIDYAQGDPLLLSKIHFTKTIIFTDRAESDPHVYWELRHFAKAFNTDTNECIPSDTARCSNLPSNAATRVLPVYRIA